MNRKSRPLKVVLGVAVFALVVFIGWTISPLFLPDSTLNQDFGSGGTILQSGSLQRVDSGHTGSGTVHLVEFSPGNQSIFFVDVSITNGPDLYVYLSKKTSFTNIYDPGEYVSLGLIPAVNGNFSVPVPNTISGTEYASVLIWCQAFSVLFTYAIFA